MKHMIWLTRCNLRQTDFMNWDRVSAKAIAIEPGNSTKQIKKK